MLTMLKRHEIQVLQRAGHTQKEIRELTGASVNSIARVAKEPPVSHVDDAAARAAARVGRPSKVEEYREAVRALMAEEPEVKSVEVLHRMRERGYRGGKSALYTLIAAVRPARRTMGMRFEGLAGEFSQHDFGHVDVRFLDGRVERVHFFASRLKYSRWVEVSLVPNERVESLVRALVDHLAAWGGLPLLAVFDRPRTIASEWGADGRVTQWNETFAYVMLELGIGVELCWPYSPQQKGSVENLVGWVKGSFFKQRRFVDDEDLLAQLGAWQREVNCERPSRATEVIPAQRLAEERSRLRPLKVTPEQLALRYAVQVGPLGDVVWETNAYAMPPEAAGMPATLFAYRDRVRLIAGRHEVEHPRLRGRNQRTALPEQRAARLALVSGRRGKDYLMRQHLMEVGPSAAHYLTEVVHRRPRGWKDEIARLHELLQSHGPAAMQQAFEQAVAQGTYGVEYVRHFLAQPLLQEVVP
jgi:transposase